MILKKKNSKFKMEDNGNSILVLGKNCTSCTTSSQSIINFILNLFFKRILDLCEQS